MMTGDVAQGEQQVAMGFGVIRLDGEGLAVAGFGFREPALVPEGVAQVAMGFGVIRLDGEGPAETGLGFRKPALSRRVTPRLLWASA